MADARIRRADRRTQAALLRLGEELRQGRLIAGLTLAEVAQATGVSTTELSRIELGQAPWVTIGSLNRIAAAVGVDLWTKTYPGGEPLRDAAHLRLTDAFRALIGPGLVVRAEVPIGDSRDLRAWDLTVTEPRNQTCGIELETRFVDAQDQLRRLTRKVSDGDVDRVLLVVADTRANRLAVRSASGLLSITLAIDDPGASAALADGRIPPRDALIFVRVAPRQTNRGVPRSRDRPGRPGREAVPAVRESGTRTPVGRGLAPVRRETRRVMPVGRDE